MNLIFLLTKTFSEIYVWILLSSFFFFSFFRLNRLLLSNFRLLLQSALHFNYGEHRIITFRSHPIYYKRERISEKNKNEKMKVRRVCLHDAWTNTKKILPLSVIELEKKSYWNSWKKCFNRFFLFRKYKNCSILT